MNVLITGATGFVGKTLCTHLIEQGHSTTAIRADVSNKFTSAHYDCLIHLAGRSHVMKETAIDVYQAYASVNIDYTIKAVELALQLKIKRFIFLSSVKVYGETSNNPFKEIDITTPQDDYGRTKLEAELLLRDFCRTHEMELIIIRSPLIYGRDVKANFKNLIKLCQSKLPLPFGAIHNKRSMVYIENLIDFITLCITHPKAANETYLISDDEDISSTQLIRTIRKSLGIPTLLIPVPQSWLVFMLNVIGKNSLSTRFCGNLQVDITKAKTLLGWKPPFTFEQGIKNTIQEK